MSTDHTAAVRTEAPARPATPTAGGPGADQLLTALVRVGRLIDEAPDETVAADDMTGELARVRETIDAAGRRAQPIRDAGEQAAQACPSDLRLSTRLRLELDVVHDIPAEELLAVLLARIELSLEDDDVDLADVTAGWEPRPVGGRESENPS